MAIRRIGFGLFKPLQKARSPRISVQIIPDQPKSVVTAETEEIIYHDNGVVQSITVVKNNLFGKENHYNCEYDNAGSVVNCIKQNY